MLCLLARKRFPGTVALAVVGLSVIWYRVGYTTGLINVAIMVACFHLGTTGDRRLQFGIGGLVCVAPVVSILWFSDAPASEALDAVGWPVVVILFGEIVRNRRLLLEELAERARSAEAERDAEADRRVTEERLSIGAAYGAIVALFQWGWGATLVGIGEPGPIEAWAPMMLFAIVFGLSIDYEVFLLSRIREEYDHTGRNDVAVADGLAKTARLITAAAAIMVCVTGAFVLSDERELQVFGLGLAIAIFVDATLVRMVLVPSAMELLGDRNWWLPRWLERALPRVNVDGSPAT